MYAFGRSNEARAKLETLRKRVEEGLSNKLPQEVPVPAPPTKSTRGITASWHNKPKSNYYSDPKITEEEFERRKNLPDGLQHMIFVERELDAELSAASRPAVAPTPDVVWVPLPVSETTATSQVPCPVPLSSQNISCPVVTQPSPLKESSSASTSTVQSFYTPLDQSREQAGTSNHLNESAERRNAFQKITDLQSEEQREKDRIASIERTIEELNSELKALTDKVLSLKQQQFDVLLSTMATNPFENDSASRFSEPTTTSKVINLCYEES